MRAVSVFSALGRLGSSVMAHNDATYVFIGMKEHVGVLYHCNKLLQILDKAVNYSRPQQVGHHVQLDCVKGS